MDDGVDVAIIGGGAAGLSLAWALAGARNVAVLEAEGATGYHSSGRSAAVFTERFPGSPVAGLARASRAFLERPPEGFAPVPLLRRRENLIVAAADKADRLRATLAAERIAASQLQAVSVADALDRAPILRPDWLAAAFLDPDCWDIDVAALLHGYARAARAQGAQIRTGARVTGGRREGAVWTLDIDAAAPLRARVVVNAAGAWADAVAASLGAPALGVAPHRRTAITVDAPGFDLGAMPMIDELDEDFYLKPDAGRLLVSPADETPSPPCDARPEEIDVAWAVHWVQTATRLAAPRPAARWAGLRSFTADRLPAIGFSAHAPGLFWLVGQGGAGILTSPAAARLAAARIIGAAGDDAFSPRRLGG